MALNRAVLLGFAPLYPTYCHLSPLSFQLRADDRSSGVSLL